MREKYRWLADGWWLVAGADLVRGKSTV